MLKFAHLMHLAEKTAFSRSIARYITAATVCLFAHIALVKAEATSRMIAAAWRVAQERSPKLPRPEHRIGNLRMAKGGRVRHPEERPSQTMQHWLCLTHLLVYLFNSKRVELMLVHSEASDSDWSEDIPNMPGILEFRHSATPDVIYCFELTADRDLEWLANIPLSNHGEPPDYDGQWRWLGKIGKG